MSRTRRTALRRRGQWRRARAAAREASEAAREASRRKPPRKPWTRGDFYDDNFPLRDLVFAPALLFVGFAGLAWGMWYLSITPTWRIAAALAGAHLAVKWVVLILVVPAMFRRIKNLGPWPTLSVRLAAAAILPDAVGVAWWIWQGGSWWGIVPGLLTAAFVGWFTFGMLLGIDELDARALTIGSTLIGALLVLAWVLLGLGAG